MKRYAALRAFGNPALIREQTRAVWSWNWLESLGHDLGFSLRTLRSTLGYAGSSHSKMIVKASLAKRCNGKLLERLTDRFVRNAKPCHDKSPNARFHAGLPQKGYETTVPGVAGAGGATEAFVFGALALSTERAFFAGTDFRAPLARMAALSAGEVAAPRAAFFPAFFTFAQRAVCPAAILARASGLTVRFLTLFTAGLAVAAFLRAGTGEV